MFPLYETTLNGFTFSTLVAKGCSIHPTLSYFKVIMFPVFCTLESKRLKLVDRSKFSSEISDADAT